MRKSYLLAIAIAVIAAGWVLSGTIGGGDTMDGASASGQAPSVAHRKAELGAVALTAVRTQSSQAQEHWREITARGHTEAKRKLTVKSEIKGRISEIAVKKGSRVRRGDVLVRIDVADRDAHMAEAQALVRQREVEFQAAKKLRSKGYRAETQFAASQAKLDGAKAMVKQMQVSLSRTVIRAPFDAIVDDRPVELGAYVKDGTAVAMLVDEDPYLVVAQISENVVGRLAVKKKGRATLVTGQDVEGYIRYIAARADETTRTFRVELLVPNPDRQLRDGVSAELHFPTNQIAAHLITPAILTLNNKGVVGVRCVGAEGKVNFYPVEIVDSVKDGVWVAGLPRSVELIVVGQEFVRQGDGVRVSNGAAKGPRDGGKKTADGTPAS